jgi:hypothetical protein
VPSPPVAAPPNILLVRLGAAFSPAQLRLGAGQQFQLAVSKSVHVSGLGVASGCAPGTAGQALAGLLSVRCAGEGSFLYTAEHTGSAVLSVTVRPRCQPGTCAPQWVTAPSLKITIT